MDCFPRLPLEIFVWFNDVLWNMYFQKAVISHASSRSPCFNDLLPPINTWYVCLLSVDHLCLDDGEYDIVNDTTGTITSLNYPHYYPQSFCGFLILGNPGDVITLTINHFDVAPDSAPFCAMQSAFLSVSRRQPQKGTVAGNNLKGLWLKAGNRKEQETPD